MTRVLTLTTDFGTQDWFVGTMKGVILGIAPRCSIVDLTHEIPAGDVRAGAFALEAACGYFPKRTIHVAVVDPGVGSARAAIAVETARFTFVGPDNGLLSRALRFEKIKAVRWIENQRYFGADVSRTFHGRDVFAPVAAHLCRGVPLSRMGRLAADFHRLPLPDPTSTPNRIRGEIRERDHEHQRHSFARRAFRPRAGFGAWTPPDFALGEVLSGGQARRRFGLYWLEWVAGTSDSWRQRG